MDTFPLKCKHSEGSGSVSSAASCSLEDTCDQEQKLYNKLQAPLWCPRGTGCSLELCLCGSSWHGGKVLHPALVLTWSLCVRLKSSLLCCGFWKVLLLPSTTLPPTSLEKRVLPVPWRHLGALRSKWCQLPAWIHTSPSEFLWFARPCSSHRHEGTIALFWFPMCESLSNNSLSSLDFIG